MNTFEKVTTTISAVMAISSTTGVARNFIFLEKDIPNSEVLWWRQSRRRMR